MSCTTAIEGLHRKSPGAFLSAWKMGSPWQRLGLRHAGKRRQLEPFPRNYLQMPHSPLWISVLEILEQLGHLHTCVANCACSSHFLNFGYKCLCFANIFSHSGLFLRCILRHRELFVLITFGVCLCVYVYICAYMWWSEDQFQEPAEEGSWEQTPLPCYPGQRQTFGLSPLAHCWLCCCCFVSWSVLSSLMHGAYL